MNNCVDSLGWNLKGKLDIKVEAEQPADEVKGTIKVKIPFVNDKFTPAYFKMIFMLKDTSYYINFI